MKQRSTLMFCLATTSLVATAVHQVLAAASDTATDAATLQQRSGPGEAKMIDAPFDRTQNGVFSIQEERIDSSGECRFR